MPRDLPTWPITLLGVSLPFLWILGLSFIFLPIVGLAAALVLIRYRHAVLPPGWYLWVGYLVFVVASAVQLDTTGRLIGFLLRFSTVLGVSAIGLYIYTATPRSLPTDYIYRSLAFLWIFVVIGGWLGVLFPEVILQTPAAQVLPGGLLQNDLVDALVRPRFAEVQSPFGVEDPFFRPAAPLTGSNGWGFNTALLAPIVARYITVLTGWKRWTLLAISISAVVPAAATLNRGLMLGLAIAIAYVAFRGLIDRNWKMLLGAVGVMVAGGLAAVATGVPAAVSERLAVSETNQTRGSLYQEAFARTLESPVLGWGAPRPSLMQDVSVGTQGHAWNIMFSHGFIALALYISFFLLMAWNGRHALKPADAAHVAVVVGLVLMWFYGLDGPQLAILIIAGTVSVRDVRLRPWPELFQPPAEQDLPAGETRQPRRTSPRW